jgi:hypothetical protein
LFAVKVNVSLVTPASFVTTVIAASDQRAIALTVLAVNGQTTAKLLAAAAITTDIFTCPSLDWVAEKFWLGPPESEKL